MPHSQVVKVRVSRRTKDSLFKVAEASQTTVSNLIRDMAYQLIGGRSHSEAVRADMALVRQLANQILSASTGTPDATALSNVGRRLRDLASRHLGPAS